MLADSSRIVPARILARQTLDQLSDVMDVAAINSPPALVRFHVHFTEFNKRLNSANRMPDVSIRLPLKWEADFRTAIRHVGAFLGNPRGDSPRAARGGCRYLAWPF